MSHELDMARIARKYPTEAERRLWSRLRRNALGWHFRRHHPVPPSVLDFACLALKMANEADGGHDRRDKFLEDNGWLVLRFWSNEIIANTDGVVAVITGFCRCRAIATPPPRLSPAARERKIS